MNMVQQQKQKHYQKDVHQKRFVINIMKFIKRFMNGLIFHLINLEEPQPIVKLRLLKIFSTRLKITDIH